MKYCFALKLQIILLPLNTYDDTDRLKLFKLFYALYILLGMICIVESLLNESYDIAMKDSFERIGGACRAKVLIYGTFNVLVKSEFNGVLHILLPIYIEDLQRNIPQEPANKVVPKVADFLGIMNLNIGLNFPTFQFRPFR